MPGRLLTIQEGASIHYRLEGDTYEDIQGLMRDIRYINHSAGDMLVCFSTTNRWHNGKLRCAGWADPKAQTLRIAA